MFLKERIAKVKDSKLTRYIIKEWADGDWDGSVFVKSLTAFERDNWEVFNIESTEKTDEGPARFLNYRSKFIAKVLCNEAGELIFSDSEDDIAIIASKDSQVIIDLFNFAREVNGYGEKKADDKVKN